MSDRSKNLTSDKKFGLFFGLVFGVVSITLFFSDHRTSSVLTSCIAISFVVLSFVAPKRLSALNQLWFLLGLTLHRITNPIVLGFIFYGLFTPLGFLMRLFGYKPLNKKGIKCNIFWLRSNMYGNSSMKDQF